MSATIINETTSAADVFAAAKKLDLSRKNLAERLGCSFDTVKNAARGLTWKTGVPLLYVAAARALIEESSSAPAADAGAQGITEDAVPAGDPSGAPDDGKLPLDEHLAGISAESDAKTIRAARASAIEDGWSDTDVDAALRAAGLADNDLAFVKKDAKSKGKSKSKKPGGAASNVPLSDATIMGLSPGFKVDNVGNVFGVHTDAEGNIVNYLVCSPMRVLHQLSQGTSEGSWTIDVGVRTPRGTECTVRLNCSEILVEWKQAATKLVNAGLVANRTTLREAVDALATPSAPLGRTTNKTGWTLPGVFVLPQATIGTLPPNEVIVWEGGQLCRAAAAGTLDDWKTNVATLADGNVLPMVACGAMLASAAIPVLPASWEVNSMLHFVGPTTAGKTTSARVGASVWGAGESVSSSRSFVHSWRTTANASEGLLAAHNNIGIVLDELASFDKKAAASFAYDFASGRAKARMMDSTALREQRSWELFAISTGEKTLGDLAAEGIGKSRVQEGGAAARVIDVPAQVVFPELHGEPDAKALAVRLGRAAATYHGTAGPAFVEWLATHEDEARARLLELDGVWADVVAGILPAGAADQARRVASRIGAIACPAALAADVLALPWASVHGGVVSIAAQRKITLVPAASATLTAFAKVFGLWLRESGGGSVSTEMRARFDELSGWVAANPGRFSHVVAGNSASAPAGQLAADTAIAQQFDHTQRAGWRVFDGTGKALLYVDVLPLALSKDLGWTNTDARKVMTAIAKMGWLMRTKIDELKVRRRDTDAAAAAAANAAAGQGWTSVYRIQTAFFDTYSG